MRLRLRSLALATLGILLVVGAAHIERYESSFLFVTHHSVYDFIGTAKERWNSMASNCDPVHVLDQTDATSKEIASYLNSGVVPGSGKASLLTVAAQRGWYLVEVEFESLEPAILVLHRESSKYRWIQDATFSGNPGPWVAGPFIRDFIRSRAPAVPKELVQCLKPKLAHFTAELGPNPKWTANGVAPTGLISCWLFGVLPSRAG